jgi:cell division protein FtsI/penicillin-binding protein 2
LELLLQGIRPTPQRVAAIYRFVDPDSGVDKFGEFMRTILPSWQPSANALEAIYDKYSPDSFSLADRGFVARVHPLELWLVRFLRAHPGSTQSQAVAASVDERQQVYGWLFKTRQKNAQDKRILGIVEVEGFLEIHRAWQRLGYPFDSLVPSYATAIGSSADRPAALAELVGILLNDGMRLPTVRVERLHFAAATPYETTTVRKKHEGKQVLNAEVAAITRRAMLRVVEQGTARRIHKAFVGADGAPIEVGGKTGTGDHRFDTYGSHGQLISSRVVSREATFVFFIGDRFFGTVTAYVPGPKAAGYSFTSSLPVQILKIISPSLMPLVEQSESNPACEQR